ncbi:DUF3710 domain-containing protein [Pseudonocardia sp.]|uniref:DUF3710 domain-containing protein n=1 Tax=Pseudonocardia sp. TaxID=60912 RepID=UPI0039C9D292
MFERGNDGIERAAQPPARPFRPGRGPAGPFDEADPRAPASGSALDLGALRIRVPPGATLRLDQTDGGVRRSARLVVPAGLLSLSVLAAPRSARLWPQLAEEVVAVQAGLGATVHSCPGDWGQEIQASLDSEHSWFIGVDGPRWMLYGVATGPVEHAAQLGAALREVIRSATVNRGSEPLPVKAALALSSAASGPRTGDGVGAGPLRHFRREPMWFTMGPTPPNATAARGGPPRATRASPEAAAAGLERAKTRGADRVAPRSGPGRALPDTALGAPGRQASPLATSREATSREATSRERPRVSTGLVAGLAGLLLVLGAGGMLALGHSTERGAPDNGALPDPGTLLREPGPPAAGPAPKAPARPQGDGRSSLAPDSAGAQPPSVPTQSPRARLPEPGRPAATDLFTVPSSAAPRLARPHQGPRSSGDTEARPDRAPGDEPEPTQGTGRDREADEEPERAPHRGVLGELVKSLDQGWLGLG